MINCSHVAYMLGDSALKPTLCQNLSLWHHWHDPRITLLRGAIYKICDTILPKISYQYSFFIQEIVIY